MNSYNEPTDRHRSHLSSHYLAGSNEMQTVLQGNTHKNINMTNQANYMVRHK